MEDNVFIQYSQEANNWLKTGRKFLVESLIQSTIRDPRELEILEIGPGVGQNIDQLDRFGEVDVAESHPLGLAALKKNIIIRTIYDRDVPFDLSKRYDLICALDVIEHIEDDDIMIAWASDHLKPGGLFLVVVPAYQWMFSSHDHALGHYRRYGMSELSEKISKHLSIHQAGFFNFSLFPIAAGIRLVKKVIHRGGSRQLKKDSSSVPGFINRILEAILFAESIWIKKQHRFPYGLSLYCVAKRENSSED